MDNEIEQALIKMSKKIGGGLDKMWPELHYPTTLKDALSTLTKTQLTSIRMNLEISNLSTLNKQGLALKLAEKMADNLWTVIRTWDFARMKLIQKIAKKRRALGKTNARASTIPLLYRAWNSVSM